MVPEWRDERLKEDHHSRPLVNVQYKDQRIDHFFSFNSTFSSPRYTWWKWHIDWSWNFDKCFHTTWQGKSRQKVLDPRWNHRWFVLISSEVLFVTEDWNVSELINVYMSLCHRRLELRVNNCRCRNRGRCTDCQITGRTVWIIDLSTVANEKFSNNRLLYIFWHRSCEQTFHKGFVVMLEVKCVTRFMHCIGWSVRSP